MNRAVQQLDAIGRPGNRLLDMSSRPAGGPGARLTPFEAVEEHGDYLLCAKVASLDADQHPVPPDPEGDLVAILKPWLLRNTPFDGKTRGGISYATKPAGYVYDAGEQNLRKATEGTDEEWQTITPTYSLRELDEFDAVDVRGEIIYAFGHAAVTVGLLEITLTDVNTAGRCWAQTDAPEEEEES